MLRLSRSLLTKNVSGQVKKITQPVASLLDEVRVNSVPTNGLSTQTATILDSAPSVLPMLPVPNLLESMERLKRATGPFAVRQKEFVEFINLVDQFASGSGIKLHQLLVNKSKQTNNWLSHDWFINKNYLQNPDPVMIWTNTALVFPKGDSGSHSLDSVANHISRTICGLLDFRDQLKLGNFPEKDLCSDQYKKIFGSSRIPGISMDAIRVGDLSLEANSIVISRNNKFYEVTLPERPELLAAVLQNAIITILTESKDVASSLPVGSLTSLPRDDWANIYPRLEPNATNAIVESQFVVCLDHISGQNLANFETDYHATIAKQVLHADQDNIGNRWHDKSVQLVFALSPNGETVLGSGINYEHTCFEAVAIARLMEHVTDFVSKTDGNWSDTARTKLSGDIIKLLSFGSDEQLEKDIGQAMEKYVDLSNSLDMNVLKFTNYGKTLVKSLQQSPDSWIQVAINWAYFRLHRHIGSCYEAAGMRKFQHGRTDIIRSVTSEMTNLYFSPSHESLLSAIASHNQLSKSVVNGNGVDRLMLGLQCVLEEIKNGTWKWGLDGDLMITDKDASDLKKLTNHNLYQRARHFNMSTSQVYSESSDSFCSYSPLVEDGYGCCYNPTSDGITFAVSAFNVGHSNCDVHKYSTELQATLCDMKDMFTKQ